MRLFIRLLILSLCHLSISFSAQAQWFETQGQAYINNNDKKSARSKAVENALKKTLLIAGASVSSVQQVVNGLLTKDELNIRATGIVNSFEIVSEQYTDDTVEVLIRADIFPQEKQCFSADYRKTLLLTKSQILHREQANIGNIYSLDKEVIRKLNQALSVESRYLHTKLNIKQSTSFSRLNESQDNNKIAMLVKAAASRSDSQFVLFSEITDISFEQDDDFSWKFWQAKNKDRQFNFSVYIFDGINGELVFNKDYQSMSNWPFADREEAIPEQQKFWQSQYGIKISQQLKDIALDIDETLMCQPTQGTIVHIEGKQLLINLGKRQGVKLNDKFNLLANETITTANGKSYPSFNVSPYQLKVVKVNRDSALLETVNEEQLGNIQINDLAVRY